MLFSNKLTFYYLKPSTVNIIAIIYIYIYIYIYIMYYYVKGLLWVMYGKYSVRGGVKWKIQRDAKLSTVFDPDYCIIPYIMSK